MGQGLYRMLGWGCLNPPHIDWDNDDRFSDLCDVLKKSYEAEPDYLMLPIAVNDPCLQMEMNLPKLPDGLPHIKPRTARYVRRGPAWPGVGAEGVWISYRVFVLWRVIQEAFRYRGVDLPEGQPVFVCDWD